ncbi:FAD-dependent oxidoreductase [Geomonas subterranea]|uniref:FAD-dependent oxidoreductase n=1 Tax=Geomonas subterranea TaxID=2847989 RepID=A0ABX8LK65_9BACT|nr:FAD-dependent oxidoreductase [Geomonas subterranea]QXE91291.1 FAD-dependent oxidoreductase [Geomonas subterranea]QXM10623.1 FAD-dependent oxidoreductase [Geomonas subterranea]
MEQQTGKYQVRILGIEEYRALTACQSACPVGTDTKRYVSAISRGDYEKAYLIARQTNPLVSVCSRVCTAPCEKSCRKGETGSPVDIRALKRFACDQHGAASTKRVVQRLDELSRRADWVSDRAGNHVLNLSRQVGKARTKQAAAAQGARVAIVGSGPTGLAAAHDLALLGYAVTIFEAAPHAGGQLRSGIPAFRLPKDVLQKEIDAILELGVELRLNTTVGADLTLTQLREEGYQAVLLTIGLQDPMRIEIEGTGLRGVHTGIDYVRNHDKIELGRSCLVIGGGGVAIDCAQHAVRQGAEQVMIACLESWETMPASRVEIEDAQEEGITFHPSLGPQRFLGEDGRVTGVQFMKVASIFDGEGRFNPSYEPDSEHVIRVDSVILAVGQASNLASLKGLEGLEVTPAGQIKAGDDMSTSLPGVFAGGDVRWRFARNATEAIADGQKAARSIHGYLRGEALNVRQTGHMRALPADFLNTRCDTIAAARIPKREAQVRVRTREEITLGFEEKEAREQAARCRQCSIQTVFDRSRCLLCGTCVDTCTQGTLKLVRLEDIEGDERLAQLTAALKKGAPGTRARTAIIKDESRCVSCGMCARRCPGGAITMAEFNLDEEWE